MITQYQGIGDTNTESVTGQVKSAYIRMAETRAIVRALRWATNIAETSIDELPDRKGQKEEEKKPNPMKV